MAHGWRSRSSGLRDLTCRSSIRSREAVWSRHSRSFGGTRGRGGLTRPLRLGPARSVSGVLYPGGVRATPRRPREGEGAVMIESNQAPAPSAFFNRKSTRLNSSHVKISYAVFRLKKNTVL